MLPKEIEPWVEERSVTPEIAPEIKDHLARVETADEVQLPQPVTDDGGAPLVSSAQPAQITITLPLDDQVLTLGLKAAVSTSWRWLAEWIKRLLKITGGRFVYKTK